MRPRKKPFLVAPWLEISTINEWLDRTSNRGLLDQNGLTAVNLFRNWLSCLQPEGTQRDIRLGYMLPVNVYDLFTKNTAGEWQFDSEKLAMFTNFFLEMGRPVVINLRANHFVGEGPLIQELMQDEKSYAYLNDGSPLRETYHNNTVFAPTFALDPTIALNRFRFGGFRCAAAGLADFDRKHPKIIQAVTIAGELHHFLPDLANASAQGRFEGAQMTDYSLASIKEYRRWLQRCYGSVAALNDRCGTPFGSWDEVEPPRFDRRTNPNVPKWSHMDSYADGYLPVFGWAAPSTGQIIRIYCNGIEVGQAEYGLSRLDVYEAIEWLRDSDVGFRFNLDYRSLEQGCHVIHAVLESNDGTSFLIGRRTIIIDRAETEPHTRTSPEMDNIPPPEDSRGRFAWLDHPPDELRLQFNRFAQEWQAFREFQVQTLLTKFARIAVEVGLSPEQLYSHQLMPHFEGAWNQLALAVRTCCVDTDLFSTGIDLYGGAAVYRGIGEILSGKAYAVTECHPRMGKASSREVFRKTLEYHRDLGADFLCPYFMSLREPKNVPGNLVNSMLIHPLNPAVGSMFFYSALTEFLNS